MKRKKCTLIETKGKQTEVRIKFPLSSIRKAFLMNPVEEKQESLHVDQNGLRIIIKPFAIETIKIQYPEES